MFKCHTKECPKYIYNSNQHKDERLVCNTLGSTACQQMPTSHKLAPKLVNN